MHAFPGHVACSSASLSEVVLPIYAADGGVVAVLDIDSAAAGGLLVKRWRDWRR